MNSEKLLNELKQSGEIPDQITELPDCFTLGYEDLPGCTECGFQDKCLELKREEECIALRD